MDLKLTILGSSSAIPLAGRNPTSQFLTIANRHFLIDCGEATQVQLRKNKIGFGRINHIMISHMHGDHFYGLVPLLTSLHLLDRQKEMHVFGPPLLEKAVTDLLEVSGTKLRFELVFHPLEMKNTEPQLIYQDKAVEVFSFPVKHSSPCCGFFFYEKQRPRNFRKEILEKHSIPVAEIRQIKKGADYTTDEGEVIANKDLTTDPPPRLSYAFCTDTLPLPDLRQRFPASPTLLYHEATFTREHEKRAKKTTHSTAEQAARVAHDVGAKYLLVGHFSVRYEEFDDLITEARQVFPQTHLALEHHNFILKSTSKLLVENGYTV